MLALAKTTSMRTIAAALMLSTAGCVGGFQQAADQVAREQARTYVNQEVARRFPGVDATLVTDCVINNASTQEIITIAGGIALGQTDAATQTVGDILGRPSTIQCTASGALGPLVGGGQNILGDLL
jgi:hypothetical protein